jgi:hypothetical protein
LDLIVTVNKGIEPPDSGYLCLQTFHEWAISLVEFL